MKNPETKPKTEGTMDNRRRQFRCLLGTLIALGAADGVISRFLIEQGYAHEMNPLLQAWVTKDSFLVIKLTGAAIAACFLWKMYRHHSRLSFNIALYSVSLYMLLVYWSLAIVFINGTEIFNFYL